MRTKIYNASFWLPILTIFFLTLCQACYCKNVSENDSNKTTALSCNWNGSTKLLPATNANGVFQVGIGIVPLGITKFNLKESSAEADFYLTIEYFLNERVSNIKCVGADASDVWKIFYNPDIEFMNIPNPEYLQGWHWLVQDNRFIYMTRVRGTVFIQGSFYKFPFDTTKIAFSTSGEDNNSVLELNPSNWYHPNLNQILTQISGIKIPGWELKKAGFKKQLDVAADGTGVWDVLTLELDLSRKSSTFIIRSGVPLLILFLVAFMSLKLPRELLDVRIGTQAAVLLALFAYSIYFIESIPATDYLTFGDFTWMSILLAVFLVMLSETLGHSPKNMAKELLIKKLTIFISVLLIIIWVSTAILIYLNERFFLS